MDLTPDYSDSKVQPVYDAGHRAERTVPFS